MGIDGSGNSVAPLIRDDAGGGVLSRQHHGGAAGAVSVGRSREGEARCRSGVDFHRANLRRTHIAHYIQKGDTCESVA